MTIASAEPGFRTVGQQVPKTIALRAAGSGRLHRTILVHGPAGAGKDAFVDDLLALLLCRTPSVADRPCNACRGCRDARARTHPDLVVASPGAWREGRSAGESIVAAARRWLLSTATAPIAGELRVVLVEHADQANEQAQNALLKALEEPAARQMFVLVAQDLGRLLPTIRSRATPLRVGPIGHDELEAMLMDRERLPADQAEALARIAGGLAGRAVGYARNPELLKWRGRVQAELLELLSRGRADRFASARELLDQAASLGTAEPPEPVSDDEPARLTGAAQRGAAMLVAQAWRSLARDLLMAGSGRAELAASGRQLPDLPAAASLIDLRALVEFMGVLESVTEALRASGAPRLAMERAMLAWPVAPAVAAGRNR